MSVLWRLVWKTSKPLFVCVYVHLNKTTWRDSSSFWGFLLLSSSFFLLTLSLINTPFANNSTTKRNITKKITEKRWKLWNESQNKRAVRLFGTLERNFFLFTFLFWWLRWVFFFADGGDTATEEMNGSGSRQNRIKTWARKLVNDLQVIDESNGKDEESSSSHSLSMKRLIHSFQIQLPAIESSLNNLKRNVPNFQIEDEYDTIWTGYTADFVFCFKRAVAETMGISHSHITPHYGNSTLN